MRSCLISVVVIVAAGVGGCAPERSNFHVGQIVQDSITVENKNIPLPPGKWTII